MFIKPILKWVGGKSQLLSSLVNYIPEEIENYHEPFVGGGSVLLCILQLQKEGKIKINKNIYAYDINAELITMYKIIQQYPNELFVELNQIISEFNTLEKAEKSTKRKNIAKLVNDENKTTNKEYYYYWIRNKYNMKIREVLVDSKEESGEILKNANLILLSALFIFLNKTCFRGVYRVNKTEFNVPYGNYANPEIINLEHLLLVSDLMKDVIFTQSNYEQSFLNFSDGDFVYADPPYFPEKITSFVNYSKDGFTLNDHIKLFELCGGIEKYESSATGCKDIFDKDIKDKDIKDKDIEGILLSKMENLKICANNYKIMISNSNTEFVKKYFENDLFDIIEIKARRSIHSKKPDSTTLEVFIIKK